MKHLFTIGLVLFSSLVIAQRHTITGLIKETNANKPLEFATVHLMQQDSSILLSTVTDKRGRFSVECDAGKYILKYGFIGFVTTYKDLVIDASIDLGALHLSPDIVTLRDVTVTSQKKTLTAEIDRKVYNVADDIAAQTGNATDVLRNIPSVEVDMEGNITLRGSGNMLILINGRPSPLLGKSPAEVLQSFPANAIERIEVITNPSARYRPDGTAGIINIVLKKDTRTGWNGSVTGSIGNRDRYNAGMNANLRTGKWNFSTGINWKKDRRLRWSTNDRTVYDSSKNILGSLLDENTFSARPVSHFITLGVEFQPNDKHSFSLSAEAYNRSRPGKGYSLRKFYNSTGNQTDEFERALTLNESETEHEASFVWQYEIGDDEALEVELTGAVDDEIENSYYTTKYYFPPKMLYKDNTLVFNRDRQQQVTVTYGKPLGENGRFETGYAGYFVQQSIQYVGENLDTTTGQMYRDLSRSNHFTYRDANHALFVTYENTVNKFGYKAGLRGERVDLTGVLVTRDSFISNSYTKLFPTLHLSYRLKTGELQLNYSKRINRPEADELNPFPAYADPLNLAAGNPKLLPEIIHSVETGYKWQNKWLTVIPSLYYRYKKDGFTNVTIPINDSVLLNTDQNLSKEESLGFEMVFSGKKGLVSFNTTVNIFYNKILFEEADFASRLSVVSMSMNGLTSFAFTKNTMLQLSTSYRSARLTPQGKQYPVFVFNSGLRQYIFQKKLSAVFTVSDLFRTQKQRTELDGLFLRQSARSRRDNPVFYIGLSYRFGGQVKKTDDEIKFDEGL